jgi:hypothetical protein
VEEGLESAAGTKRDLSKQAVIVIGNTAGKPVLRKTEDVGGQRGRVCSHLWLH